MQFSIDMVEPPRKKSVPRTRRFAASPITRVIAIATVAMTLASPGRLNSQQDERAQSQPGTEPPAKRAPDARDQIAMREEQPARTSIDAAGSERKQMSDDSTRLLKLANDLKAEVDKSSKDTLSIGVIRKADEIEKLAKSVREKIKHSINGN